ETSPDHRSHEDHAEEPREQRRRRSRKEKRPEYHRWKAARTEAADDRDLKSATVDGYTTQARHEQGDGRDRNGLLDTEVQHEHGQKNGGDTAARHCPDERRKHSDEAEHRHHGKRMEGNYRDIHANAMIRAIAAAWPASLVELARCTSGCPATKAMSSS